MGLLGDGTSVWRNYPDRVLEIDQIIGIAAGTTHNLALRRDQTVWAWGCNLAGQLGDEDIWIFSDIPVQTSGLSDVVAVEVGYGHSMAIRDDRTIWTWGQNSLGQLGNGGYYDSAIPLQVEALSNVIEIAGGGWHSLAVAVSPGDINRDGHIDGVDALLIFQYLNGFITLSDEEKVKADVDIDGEVTYTDALYIMKCVSGECEELPPFFASVCLSMGNCR